MIARIAAAIEICCNGEKFFIGCAPEFVFGMNLQSKKSSRDIRRCRFPVNNRKKQEAGDNPASMISA
jgi:hypothetical protein